MKFTLSIVFDSETRNVDVTGPVDDQLLAYGMLKLGELALTSHYEAKKRSPIVTPPMVFPPSKQ